MKPTLPSDNYYITEHSTDGSAFPHRQIAVVDKKGDKKIDTRFLVPIGSYASMVFSPDLAAHMSATVSKICPTPDRATMPMRAPSPGV